MGQWHRREDRRLPDQVPRRGWALPGRRHGALRCSPRSGEPGQCGRAAPAPEEEEEKKNQPRKKIEGKKKKRKKNSAFVDAQPVAPARVLRPHRRHFRRWREAAERLMAGGGSFAGSQRHLPARRRAVRPPRPAERHRAGGPAPAAPRGSASASAPGPARPGRGEAHKGCYFRSLALSKTARQNK